MKKLFLKVYLPLAICVFMTLVLSVVAIMRIIPAQIRAHRETVEEFGRWVIENTPREREEIQAMAEEMDLDVIVAPKHRDPGREPPPEGYYALPGLPWNYSFRIMISGGSRGGPAGFLRQSFWLILLLLLVSEGFVLFVALRPVRKRLAKLQWAASELGSGNLGMQLQVKEKGDLIDDVGRTFNIMADQIKSLVDSHRELLGIVAHELRTPMARMRLALELLREDSGEAGSSKLDRMEKDLVALDGLVTELLEYNRLGREKLKEKEKLDLAGICRELLHAESWSREDLKTEITGNAECTGDRGLIGRALGNLVRNAVRYAESRVKVTLRQDSASGGCTVVVADDGKGFDPKMLDRLGEPFAKGKDSPGVGLGLAIAERIISLHDGSMDFGSSRELGGAEVRVELS